VKRARTCLTYKHINGYIPQMGLDESERGRIVGTFVLKEAMESERSEPAGPE